MKPILPIVLFATLLAACDSTGVDQRQSFTFPESDVSFNAHVKPFFLQSCAFSGCHDHGTMAGGFALETYTDLFQQPGLVLPKDSSSSVLVQVLFGRLPHVNTPYFTEVTDNQRRGVAVWIEEGAHDN